MTCLGCTLIETAPVTLRTGEVVCSSCEGHRQECEARAILARPSTADRREYLDIVERKRGKPHADALRAVIMELWEKRRAA